MIGQIFTTSQTKQQQTTNHGQTMQSVETTGCIDNIASSLSTGLSVNPSVGSHTHAAHPLALTSCTMHITCTAHHARTSRTAHRSARHHIGTRSAHSHAHAPQPVRRQGGALAKLWRPRLPRTATRRSAPVYPALAFLCFSAHLTISRNASARHQHQSACLKHIHDARAYLRASLPVGVVRIQVFLTEMLQCSETQAGWHGKAFRRKLRAVVCGRPCRIT